MDLNQRKLSKSEWDSIEVPCSDSEKNVLNLIKEGYHNVDIKYNKNKSLLSFLKMEGSDDMHYYLYLTYFAQILNNHNIDDLITIPSKKKPTIKKGEKIRLDNNKIERIKRDDIFEYILCSIINKLLKYEKENNNLWMNEYINLYKLSNLHILNINKYIINLTHEIIRVYENKIDMLYILENAVDIIEKNKLILKYSDLTLYQHQKDLFKLMKKNTLDENVYSKTTPYISYPKLALYIAPTGTGKTMTPIGLSEEYKIIFICAARHVGLALSKACISANKKVAFAFGCSDINDIRLHYSAAKDYSINKKSGGIGKVDNSNGSKVEIIISDVKSYLYAMEYMTKFNSPDDLLLYWDEPTIALDYENHEIHNYIQKNWSNNIIPNIVLSSATLPKIHEMSETIKDFKNKFHNGEILNITSYDCKKSIPIIDNNGHIVVPHYLSEEYDTILKIVKHCKNNLTLLRYMDLGEIVRFIVYVQKNNYIRSQNLVEKHFRTGDDISMQKIKIYYLSLLENIIGGKWGALYVSFCKDKIQYLHKSSTTLKKYNSIGLGMNNSNYNPSNLNNLNGKPLKKISSEPILDNKINGAMYISTKDAHTLTDGPTIFLADDVEKVAKFCIQQANIPSKAMEDIMAKIEFNNKINVRITILEKKIETIEENNLKKESNNSVKDNKKKSDTNTTETKEIKTLNNEITTLRSLIKVAELNDTFVPNKKLHLDKWAYQYKTENAYTSDIDEDSIYKIMMLHDVEDSWKVLLLMGIGVFTNHSSNAYTEIMKNLADNQKLYLIIASSDYIYGTNYQFCHGYLSKQMSLSQEKIIQALGRIGRNNIQQSYSIRIRDSEQINKIFYEEKDKIEVINMNRLFTTNSE